MLSTYSSVVYSIMSSVCLFIEFSHQSPYFRAKTLKINTHSIEINILYIYFTIYVYIITIITGNEIRVRLAFTL